MEGLELGPGCDIGPSCLLSIDITKQYLMNGDLRLTSCIWLQVYPFKGRFGTSEHDYKLIPPILRKRTLSDSSLRINNKKPGKPPNILPCIQ